MNPDEMTYEALAPEGPLASDGETGSAPLPSLDGKTIAQLWDYRFRGDEIFEHLRDEITVRYPSVKFVSYEVFGNVHGHRETEILEDLPRMLREYGCDAVLSGIGA